MEKETFNFQLRGIELLESHVITPENPIPNPIFQFDINVEHKISSEQKLVFVLCTINIYSEKRENSYGRLRTSCIYHIGEFDNYFDDGKNVLNLPAELNVLLNSVALSTTRGIMFSAFRGTILHNAILPLIDPNKFILGTQKNTAG